MGKILIPLVCLLFILLSACSSPPIEVQQGSSGDAVFIKIWEDGTESGISTDASEVVIKNFHSGAKAEMVYRIHNATGKAIQPEIYWTDADVSTYSKADGAVQTDVRSWLTLPSKMDVPAGSIREYTVTLQMPKSAKKHNDKIGFQIGVANMSSDKVQTAVGTWWLISMR